MSIRVLEEISLERLIDGLRSTSLLARDNDGFCIFPYEDSSIFLKSFGLNEGKGLDCYATGCVDVEKLGRFRSDFMREYGVDVLKLERGYVVDLNDGREFGVVPPVLEEDGDLYRVRSGANSVVLARETEEGFNGIVVSGVFRELPVYQFRGS